MKILFLVPPETISLESSVPKALEGGKGYYVAGSHEKTIPALWTFINRAETLPH